MIRVIGNSPERIPIVDLGDVIYYKQEKEYSDQEYASSRDLQRAVRRGHLSILEQSKAARGSLNGKSVSMRTDSPISLSDIKRAVREVIPEVTSSNGSQDVRNAIREVIPMIVDTVRQELSSLVVNGVAARPAPKKQEFVGPEYIPDVNTDGMVSNVEADERKSEGSGLSSNLDALRRLKKSK